MREDIRPEDFKELDEHDKQAMLTDRLEHLYEGFIHEFNISEISVIGTFTLFTNALMLHYRDNEDEEDD